MRRSTTYDALNHRVRTVVGSAVTEFVFSALGRRVSVWNGSTKTQIQGQYYWGTQPIAYYRSGSAHFQHQDWLGTERARTGYQYAGTPEATFTSLPYGDALTTATGTDTDAYHSSMLDHDPESGSSLSGSDHGQFRQYSPTQGRWLRPDPYAGSYDYANPQTFNRYAYTVDSPCSGADPLGLDTCTFNIRVKNKAKLTDPQLSQLENQINAVLGSAQSDGNSVQADFSAGGSADFNLNISPKTGLLGGEGWSGWPFWSPTIYWGSISDHVNGTYAGAAAAHEIVHRGAGPRFDLTGPYIAPPNLMNVNQAQDAGLSNQVGSDWSNAQTAQGFASLNADQVKKLYNRCRKKHPKKGGAGGGGGGGGDVFWYIWGTNGGGDDGGNGGDNNGDSGPGSGWCPDCGDPILIPRGDQQQ